MTLEKQLRVPIGQRLSGVWGEYAGRPAESSGSESNIIGGSFPDGSLQYSSRKTRS